MSDELTGEQPQSTSLIKRIIRGAAIGAAILAILAISTLLLTAGKIDGAMPSQEQYLSAFPDRDYGQYVMRSVMRLMPEALVVGAMIGAAYQLIRWAFSR